MIGTKLYQNKSRVYFFLVMYSVLAVVGIILIALSLSRNQNPSGAEGFTLIFGAGMAILTWYKGRKPRVIIGETSLELYQQNKPRFIAYKDISTVTRTKDQRLVIAVRDGHTVDRVTVWLKELEEADAEKLVDYCNRKGWKKRER